MNYLVSIIIYLGLCILIAYIGRNRKFGFWGFFFSSLLITPMAGFLAYLASCEKIKIHHIKEGN